MFVRPHRIANAAPPATARTVVISANQIVFRTACQNTGSANRVR
jgi:hypothetical protein